jgi:hypothetical protein
MKQYSSTLIQSSSVSEQGTLRRIRVSAPLPASTSPADQRWACVKNGRTMQLPYSPVQLALQARLVDFLLTPRLCLTVLFWVSVLLSRTRYFMELTDLWLPRFLHAIATSFIACFRMMVRTSGSSGIRDPLETINWRSCSDGCTAMILCLRYSTTLISHKGRALRNWDVTVTSAVQIWRRRQTTNLRYRIV